MKLKATLLSTLILTLSTAVSSPNLWAQRGDDRGGDRGGDRGSSRGGDRGDRGGGDRGGDRGGFRGGGFGGGGFGGPPGGGFGGGFGGPPGGFGGGFGGPPGGFGGGGFGGGFGGPMGGGSFSPIDMLRRLDRNANGSLEPEEQEGPASFFLSRMAQNNPRIDLSKPIPLDRLAGEMDRMRQERMGGAPGMAPGSADDEPTEPEPLVPGFDKIEEKSGVPGFGIPDENASIKTEDRDLREAEDRIRRYDANKDGVLSKEELQSGRWPEDPLTYDRNNDGKLTKNELAVRYAKRRLGEQGQLPGAQGGNNNDPRSRFAGMNPWGGGGGSGWGGRGGFGGDAGGGWGNRGGGDNGGGWGSRDEGEQKKEEKKDLPKSYRNSSVRDKTETTKGLPEWFARSDADGDGQVMMSEYSPNWSADKVAEFAKFDLNNDGIVTSRECLTSLKNGGSSTPTIASSSSSSANSAGSSSGAGASIVSGPGTSSDEATLKWGQRMMSKYDKNGDGRLTVDEWSSMTVKPKDADGDGVITLEEYIKSRTNK